MSITVIKPGLLSSFQDFGRVGAMHLGIPVCGACDLKAHQLANILCGNDTHHATLEITLMGPELKFNSTAIIALSGANLLPHLDHLPLNMNQLYVVQPGQVLRFRNNTQHGMRSYLALAGGFNLDRFLGSQSTYIKAGLGGLGGRSLKAGDVIHAQHQLNLSQTLIDLISHRLNKPIKDSILHQLGMFKRNTIRVLKGVHWDAFTEKTQKDFEQYSFKITPKSERMGFRLEGPKLELKHPMQILSEPVSLGTIQVPADGNPIVLMSDRQTTGGYPKIANVIGDDLSVLAQIEWNQEFKFKVIGMQRAQAILQERAQAFAKLQEQRQEITQTINQHLQKSG